MNELIVFEGIDGGGKSTQMKRLGSWLRGLGFATQEYKEPTDGPMGSRIRQLAKAQQRLPLEEEYALFLEDRRWNRDEQMKPALGRGEFVLLDRYYYSTAAYQGIRGKDPEQILQENEAFALLPGLTFIFELSVEKALERIQISRGDALDAFERQSDLEKIAAIFQSLHREEIVRVNADQPADDLEQEIRRHVRNRFARLKELN